MKRHLLFIQSLLLLPFISVSFLSSMERADKQISSSIITQFGMDEDYGSVAITMGPIEEIIEEPISLSFINTKQLAQQDENKKQWKPLTQMAIDEGKEKHIANLLNIHAELLDLHQKMNPSHKLDLTQSMIVAPTPTTEGLTGWLYTKSFIYTPEELIYQALKQGSFDPSNKTHIKYLEEAFDYQIKQNNTRRILTMLNHCTAYTGQMDLNQRLVREIHTYLENKNNEEEALSKKAIEDKNANFVLNRNIIIKAFQKETIERIQELHKQLDSYTQDHADTFHNRAQSIREHRTGNAGLHLMSPLAVFSHDAQCSDKHPHQQTAFILPKQVDNTITDKHLLNKIGLDKKHTTIIKDSCDYLVKLNKLNKHIQDIKLINS